MADGCIRVFGRGAAFQSPQELDFERLSANHPLNARNLWPVFPEQISSLRIFVQGATSYLNPDPDQLPRDIMLPKAHKGSLRYELLCDPLERDAVGNAAAFIL